MTKYVYYKDGIYWVLKKQVEIGGPTEINGQIINVQKELRYIIIGRHLIKAMLLKQVEKMEHNNCYVLMRGADRFE